MPSNLCAVAYDENDCDRDDWSKPLDVPETSELDLGILSEYRESIESVSVRAGCTLTLYDEGDLDESANWAEFKAPADRGRKDGGKRARTSMGASIS